MLSDSCLMFTTNKPKNPMEDADVKVIFSVEKLLLDKSEHESEKPDEVKSIIV